MATAKKTTDKKQAPKAKKADVIMTPEDMQKALVEKQSTLLEAMRSHRAGELVNPRVLAQTRKEIARLHTALRIAEITAQKESK